MGLEKQRVYGKLKKKFDFFIQNIYIYRYDIFVLLLLFIVIRIFLAPLFQSGQIVFSDLDFGINSKKYPDEIFGLWNERWSTSTMLNIPRLGAIIIPFLISSLFGFNGGIFLKSFIFILIYISSLSMYLLSKRLVSIFYSKDFNLIIIFTLFCGSLYYAINPWVIMRIQHIFLLCGYSLFPLIIRFYFNAFHPKFQNQLIQDYDLYKIGLYKRNILDIFLLAFFFNLSSGAIHYFFYESIFLIILEILLLMRIFIKNGHKQFYKIIINSWIKIGLFFVFFLLLGGFWFLSYVGSIVFDAQASQYNINVLDNLTQFSRYSDLGNVVLLTSYWWPMFDLKSLPITFYISGYIILGFIFYSIIFESGKRGIILFFSFVSLLFMIFATGVKYPFLSNIFIKVVIKIPIIGSIFRDPNKLAGLMAVGFAVLLSFSLVSLLKKIENIKYNKILSMFIIMIYLSSYILYIYPFYNNYIEKYYSAVKIPNDYYKVQNNLIQKDRFDSKILYLPFSEYMTRSDTGVSTPKWNINGKNKGNKATGDFHIYSSEKNTVFINEGNAQSIRYYINYIQYLLDNGLSRNIGKMTSAFGINELGYHDEYLGQESRQDFNEQILNIQPELNKHYSGDIFKLYELKEKLPMIGDVKNLIYTTFGLSHLDRYFNQDKFSLKNYGVIFATLDNSFNFDNMKYGDKVETESFNDLLLTSLQDKYLIKPFDFIDNGNPYLTWAKTYVNTNDWLWYLSSNGIRNFPFDFDFNAGIALTFSPSKLNVLPFQLDKIKGKIVYDFEYILKNEKFFRSENPEVYKIEPLPEIEKKFKKYIMGELNRGYGENIWQIAKSGFFDAKNSNPYRFAFLISGVATNKMHLKVKFYDKNYKEIGLNYIVPQIENENYNYTKFYGECITPLNASYMRFEILSLKNPKAKTYWWIHDFNVFDLSEYKARNAISIVKKYDKSDYNELYARVFFSQKGGRIKININNYEPVVINTYSTFKNSFEWVKIGKYKLLKGNNRFDIENIDGFNGINVLTAVPENEFQLIKNHVNQIINKVKIFSLSEAESDFEYTGNIQSGRKFPDLNGGSGLTVLNGSFKKEIEILKSDYYSFKLNFNLPDSTRGLLNIVVLNNNQDIVYKKDIDCSLLKEGKKKAGYIVDFSDKEGFPFVLNNNPRILNGYQTLYLKNIKFEKGKYTIKIIINSDTVNIVDLNKFYKYKEKEIILPKNLDKLFDSDNSDKFTLINKSSYTCNNANDDFVIKVDKTLSCGWYVYTSDFLSIEENEDYYFTGGMKSENILNRHVKFYFLDKNKKVIKNVVLKDVPEKEKHIYHEYEQIITSPKNAKYLQIHILCNGNSQKDGKIDINYFELYNYNDFITFDSIGIFEGNEPEAFFESGTKALVRKYQKIDKMKYEIYLEETPERKIINFSNSPNKLWEIKTKDGCRLRPLVLNAVSSGFIIKDTGKITIQIFLRNFYYINIILIILGFVLFIFLYFIRFNKN